MFKMLKKEELSDLVILFEIEAQGIAKKAKAGNFFTLRIDEQGERIPLTIADFDRDRGNWAAGNASAQRFSARRGVWHRRVLNSAIGVALAHGLSPRFAETLPVIQNELFHLGSDLAFREQDKQQYKLPQIEERHVQKLENSSTN